MGRHLVEGNVEHDRLGNPEKGQIAGDPAAVVAGLFGRGGYKGYFREFFDIEEIRRPQVLVAGFVIGIDAGRLDRDADLGLRGIFGIEGEISGEILKFPEHLGIAQMVDDEEDVGVRGVDCEIVCGPGLGRQGELTRRQQACKGNCEHFFFHRLSLHGVFVIFTGFYETAAGWVQNASPLLLRQAR